MMKKFFYPLLVVLFLQGLSTASAQTKGYTVTGEAEGTVDGDTIFLCVSKGYFLVPTDTTLVKDGKFRFNGNCDGCTMRYVRPRHEGEFDNMGLAQILLENGADIHVKTYMSVPKFKNGEVESNGVNNRLWVEYQQISKRFNEGMDEYYKTVLYKSGTEKEQEIAQAKIDSVTRLITSAKKEFLLAHMDVPVCDLILANVYKNLNYKEQEEILDIFGKQYPEGDHYKSIAADARASAPTAIGKVYTDLTMAGLDGKTMKVSDYVGKNRYTLVDFWASWCGPCRNEMPFVMEAYNLFHDKEFEVVGISFDDKGDAWWKAVDDLNLPWPQMSDLKGWSSEGAKIYNIKGIPANVLIDREGRIVAKDLRGHKLIQELEGRFK